MSTSPKRKRRDKPIRCTKVGVGCRQTFSGKAILNNRKGQAMRITLIALLFITLITGCSKSTVNPQWDKISALEKEKSQLEQQTKSLTAENAELKKLNKTLASLDKDVRSEALNRLDRIEIHNRSAIFTKDDNGPKEKLIVYIKPFDDVGDAYKASGSVEVELWNLDSDPTQAKVGKWTVEPQQLKKLWSSTFMTSYFRLTFDVDGKIPQTAENLTVKIKFTDYITGKTFNSQKEINRS